MTLAQTMAALKKAGTAQNVKIYKRHGAGDNLFGVSFANLGQLKKQIKQDHDLAVQLWETGNTDAQTLALMIADPERITLADARRWIGSVSYYLLADMMAALIARTPFAHKAMLQWMKARHEFTRQCGYDLVGLRLRDGETLDEGLCAEILATIEEKIHKAPNRARHAMNNALIAIGSYNPVLTETALKAAARIGKVEVDHGETSCKTPDAAGYIKKTVAHLKKKKKR